MVSPNLNTLFEQIRSLPPDDRQRLREFLDALPPSSSAVPAGKTPGEQIDELALKTGLIERIPPPMDPEQYRRWGPVTFEGKPVSETLIEERR